MSSDSIAIATQFSDLSDEVLLNILIFSTPNELIRLRQTCQRLKNLVGDQRIWENLLFRDYNLRRESLWNDWPAEEIYKAVHKVREVLGMWHCDLSHFGILIRISIENDGIVAFDCAPPLDDSFLDVTSITHLITINDGVDYDDQQRYHRFRFQRLFALIPTITVVSSDSPATVRYSMRYVCYQSMSGVHFADENGEASNVDEMMEEIFCLKKVESGIEFNCLNKREHQSFDYRYWMECEHGFRLNDPDQSCLDTVITDLKSDKDYDLRLEKFDARSNMTCLRLSRLAEHSLPPFGLPKARHFNQQPTNINVDPCSIFSVDTSGFYFGHFSWHGWELLSLNYGQDGWTLFGEKVIGDQMIPARRPSFRVDFRQPRYLTFDDQATMASLRMALRRITLESSSNNHHNQISDHQVQLLNGHHHASSSSSSSSSLTYPFRVPSDCVLLGTKTIPDNYVSCFMAEGQIAFPNYCNPRYLSCLFVVFDDLHIGLLWLDLRCFMPMYKVLNPCCS